MQRSNSEKGHCQHFVKVFFKKKKKMPCHCAEYGNVLVYTTLLFLIPMCLADTFNSFLIAILIMTSLRYHLYHSKSSRRIDVLICYIVSLSTFRTMYMKGSVLAFLTGVAVPCVCYLTSVTSTFFTSSLISTEWAWRINRTNK